MIVRRASECLLLLIVYLTLVSCGSGGLCSSTILDKKGSPSGAFEVQIIDTQCGATTGQTFRIYIVRSGEEIEEDSYVFLADRIEGLSVVWVDDFSLKIEYEQARIFQYRNFWQSKTEKGLPSEVKITEQQI